MIPPTENFRREFEKLPEDKKEKNSRIVDIIKMIVRLDFLRIGKHEHRK